MCSEDVLCCYLPNHFHAITIPANGVSHKCVCCSWHFDFTYPPAYLAHTLTNVPMPGFDKQQRPTLPSKSGAAISAADSSKRTGEGKNESKKAK